MMMMMMFRSYIQLGDFQDEFPEGTRLAVSNCSSGSQVKDLCTS